MTKIQMQERIDELTERLNNSNEAYMDLQRRYNELNEQKGNIVGFDALREQYRQLEIRLDCLKDSLEHERKHKEELREKYQNLYKEHEKLKNEQSRSKDNDYLGMTSDSMILYLKNMYDDKMQEVTNKVYKLNSIFEKTFGINGLTMRIDAIDDMNYLYITYDEKEIERKHKRKAGRRRDMTIFIKHKVSPQEARERMQNGEKAENIAKEIGISRAYFFRKLKEAEENNYPYIGWTSDDYAIEEDFI